MASIPIAADRMADPVLRRRVAVLLVALGALVWILVTIGARAGGPFSTRELQDLSGVPVPPPQIEQRFAPEGSPLDDFARQFSELRRRVSQVPRDVIPSSE